MRTKELPASVGAKLLGINRSSIYYKGAPIPDEELACKEIIDHLHTDNPSWYRVPYFADSNLSSLETIHASSLVTAHEIINSLAFT